MSDLAKRCSRFRIVAVAVASASVAALVVLDGCSKTNVAADNEKVESVSQSSSYSSKDGSSKDGAKKSPNGSGMLEKTGANGRTNSKLPALLVITAVAREEPFAIEVEALGTSKANESIDVTAKVSNRIAAIRFREGQFVRAGTVLVELDTEEARADLAIAEAALSDSRSQVNRSRELYQTKALSAQQMEQLESTLRANEARVAAAKSRLDDQIIRAPFAGRVGLRNVSVGGLVNSGTVITTLDDISIMKLDFSVPETHLAALSEGLEVAASSAAYAGEVFRGRVLSVGSRVDPVSRSIVVRAQLANREGKLKPGMFMTVHLSGPNNRTLIIPEQALVPERDKQFVFEIRDGKTYKTEIFVGRRRRGEVEVLKGLQAGDVVVIEGTQKVHDGGSVKVASGTE